MSYTRMPGSLKHDVETHGAKPRVYGQADQANWTPELRAFWESGDPERFAISDDGRNLLYLVQRKDGIWLYSRPLGVDMEQIGDQYRQAREAVERSSERDLRRGLVSTFVLLGAAVWVASLAWLVLMAYRVSRPIRQLTAGLDRLASNDLSVRLETAQRRNRSGDPGFQRHGRAAGGKPRPPGLPHAARKLAGARAEDGTRVEEFTDSDPAHDGGNHRAAGRRGRPFRGAGGADHRR